METKVLVAIIAVVAVAGVGGLVMIGGESEDEPVTYKYALQETNGCTGSSGILHFPDDGKIFVKATIDVTCNKDYQYTGGVYYFELNSNGISYIYDTIMTDLATVGPGETKTTVLIYEIPSSYSSLSIQYAGPSSEKVICKTAGPITSLTKINDVSANFTYSLAETNGYQSNSYISTPAAGKIFVKATITVNCDGTTKFPVDKATPPFKLTADGTDYSYKYYVQEINEKPAPGESKTAIVIYEIPESFTNLSLSYSGDGYAVCKTAGPITSLPKVQDVTPSIQYDYNIESTTTSFTTVYSTTKTADAGNKYVIVQVLEKNVSYPDTYHPSTSHFKLKCSDGIQYSASGISSLYSNDNDGLYNISLGIGSSKSYHLVFEIPTSANAQSIVENISGSSYIAEQNTSLL